MQITARKQRFSPVNIKYAAAALGIAGALAAGVVTYTVTRDDSQASQSVAAPLQAYSETMAGENTLGGSPAVPAPAALEQDRPALREGFQATGPGDDITGSSPKMRDESMTYLADGTHEGFIAEPDSDGLSNLAPAVLSYADMLYLEQNGVIDLAPEDRSSASGMLYEEYTQQNPGAGTQTQSTQRHSTPALANW